MQSNGARADMSHGACWSHRGRLAPGTRIESLKRLEEQRFDLLVIGGGVTGLGTALDAATRGLSVVLLEKDDFAAGTSSRSSKLIHGGLRYLEHLQLGLVREALAERGRLLEQLAPHLVRPIPFAFPLYGSGMDRLVIRAGVMAYDALDKHSSLPRHQHLNVDETLTISPALRSELLRGSVRYWDAQVDDARFCIALARTAARAGAVVLARMPVTDLQRAGGRVSGVVARDVESSRRYSISARYVINATGVWAGDLVRMATGKGAAVRPSKGVHLVLPRTSINSRSALITRARDSVLLVLPWGDHWIVGTTDTDCSLESGSPVAERHDVDYLLSQVNRLIRPQVTHDDIVSTFAGLRPLVTGAGESPSALSRDHVVSVSVPGMITVSGGKLTTYRVMAKDAVDCAALNMEMRVPDSITHRHGIEGSDGFRALWNRRDELADSLGLARKPVERLLRRYGTDTLTLLDSAGGSRELLKAIPGSENYLAIEALFGVTHEGAMHLEDVLARRTRIMLETEHNGRGSARYVASLMGDALGWDRSTTEEEVSSYFRLLESQRHRRPAHADS